jgi:hypothetical protein
MTINPTPKNLSDGSATGAVAEGGHNRPAELVAVAAML